MKIHFREKFILCCRANPVMDEGGGLGKADLGSDFIEVSGQTGGGGSTDKKCDGGGGLPGRFN